MFALKYVLSFLKDALASMKLTIKDILNQPINTFVMMFRGMMLV